jgi:ABC-2 type transport system ATP-binding protein
VLFLDEPTIGLDVAMQVTMRSFIKEYNERHGATLILTSHYMDDVAALCPRVIVIDKGALSYDGGLDALVQRVRPEKRVVFRLEQPVEESRLASLGRVVSNEAGSAVLQVPPEAVSATIGRALASLPVTDLTVENAPLEEVMSELFSENKARRAAAASQGGA